MTAPAITGPTRAHVQETTVAAKLNERQPPPDHARRAVAADVVSMLTARGRHPSRQRSPTPAAQASTPLLGVKTVVRQRRQGIVPASGGR